MIYSSKKANVSLLEKVIFIVLNMVFFLALIVFISRMSSGSSNIEEVYAKNIALSIDAMESGTQVNISVSEVYSAARKNKFSEFPIVIQDNVVTVKAIRGTGYGFRYFSNKNVSFQIDKSVEGQEVLSIKVD